MDNIDSLNKRYAWQQEAMKRLENAFRNQANEIALLKQRQVQDQSSTFQNNGVDKRLAKENDLLKKELARQKKLSAYLRIRFQYLQQELNQQSQRSKRQEATINNQTQKLRAIRESISHENHQQIRKRSGSYLHLHDFAEGFYFYCR